MKKDPSLRSQASAIFIGSLLGTLFQFLIPAVIVRLISQEDFGIYRQFILVAGTFISLLGMGYSSSLFYFYPISDFKGRQKIIQQTQILYVINLIIFVVIFYLFGNNILTFLNFKEFIDLKILIVLMVTFEILASAIKVIFTLEKNTLMNKIFPPIQKIIRFFIFLIAIIIIPGYKGPIYALIIHAVIILIYFIYHIRPYLKTIYKLDFSLFKKQLIYTLPFGFALILNLISTRFDKFFINQYISPKEYGIYSLAFLNIPILKQFYNSINSVVVPEIAISFNNNDLPKATKLWQRTVDKTSSVTIPAVILFWLLANEIITILYTIEYIEAASYYRIFILMFFISMFRYEIILRGSNNTKYILYSNIIGTVITIILGLVLIPKMGLYGAILTATFGAVIPMLISLHFERKIMQLNFFNWVNWKGIGQNFLSCLLVGVPLYFFKDYINNIFLRSFLVASIFITFVGYMQIRHGTFLFIDKVNKFKKYIKK